MDVKFSIGDNDDNDDDEISQTRSHFGFRSQNYHKSGQRIPEGAKSPQKRNKSLFNLASGNVDEDVSICLSQIANLKFVLCFLQANILRKLLSTKTNYPQKNCIH